VRVLVEASHFHESRHFGRGNVRGFKHNSGYTKLECHSRVANSQSFLGLVGYCKRSIKGFSKISEPMTKLLGKDKKFNWTPAREIWN
jgi:hypothetical protein